ncbi:MAG TPA: hypothetical protein VKU84_16740 [Stellaceae bacterium]|nr:hypothetical protein [Stellaceae bacterium]
MPSSGALWNEVVRFHLMAAKVWQTDNFAILGQFVATNDALGVAASFGALLAFLRRDWLVAPLLAWLATTLILLAVQSPLFKHHLVVLVPPLISLAVLGLGDLPPKLARMLSERLTELLMRLLVLTAVLAGIVDSYRYYRHLTSPAESDIARSAAEIAVDLRERTTADQWTITDAQFITALADRDTPPWLVDTSRNRILAGYLTTQELLANASNPRVHAVLFATNRLALEPTANFHDWVLQHFALARRYGPGVELWIR